MKVADFKINSEKSFFSKNGPEYFGFQRVEVVKLIILDKVQTIKVTVVSTNKKQKPYWYR